MEGIQGQYASLIMQRDPNKTRALWKETGIPPNEKNLQLILEVGKRVQECIDIRSKTRSRRDLEADTPPDTRHWNLYVDIQGLGGE